MLVVYTSQSRSGPTGTRHHVTSRSARALAGRIRSRTTGPTRSPGVPRCGARCLGLTRGRGTRRSQLRLRAALPSLAADEGRTSRSSAAPIGWSLPRSRDAHWLSTIAGGPPPGGRAGQTSRGESPVSSAARRVRSVECGPGRPHSLLRPRRQMRAALRAGRGICAARARVGGWMVGGRRGVGGRCGANRLRFAPAKPKLRGHRASSTLPCTGASAAAGPYRCRTIPRTGASGAASAVNSDWAESVPAPHGPDGQATAPSHGAAVAWFPKSRQSRRSHSAAVTWFPRDRACPAWRREGLRRLPLRLLFAAGPTGLAYPRRPRGRGGAFEALGRRDVATVLARCGARSAQRAGNRASAKRLRCHGGAAGGGRATERRRQARLGNRRPAVCEAQSWASGSGS